jgi:hypothetical protein
VDEYALHDKDHYLEFVFGMWFHTLAIAGKPSALEVIELLPDWPRRRRAELLVLLQRHNVLRVLSGNVAP